MLSWAGRGCTLQEAGPCGFSRRKTTMGDNGRLTCAISCSSERLELTPSEDAETDAQTKRRNTLSRPGCWSSLCKKRSAMNHNCHNCFGSGWEPTGRVRELFVSVLGVDPWRL